MDMDGKPIAYQVCVLCLLWVPVYSAENFVIADDTSELANAIGTVWKCWKKIGEVLLDGMCSNTQRWVHRASRVTQEK